MKALWAVLAAAVLTGCSALGVVRVDSPAEGPVVYATISDLDRPCVSPCGRVGLRIGTTTRWLDDAAGAVPVNPLDEPAHVVTAGLAISGDGYRVAYVGRDTHQIMVADLRTGQVRAVSPRLPGDAKLIVTRLHMSASGRYIAATVDVDPPYVVVADVDRAKVTTIREAARVLGVSDDRVVTASMPLGGSLPLDAEMLTFDFDGKVLHRAPMDPSLWGYVSPDGTRLAILTDTDGGRGKDLVLMDTESGRVVDRRRLVPAKGQLLSQLHAWRGDGRIVIGLMTADDRDGFAAVDPATGTITPILMSKEERAKVAYVGVLR